MQDEINATIQWDKLTLCCTSTVENNFNHTIMFNSDEAAVCSHSFGYTTLHKEEDNSRRYKYCYQVTYGLNIIGNIKFGLYGQPQHDDKIWFSIYIKTFYDNAIQFLPAIFENLNLNLHHVTRIHIALDNYKFKFDAIIRRNLRNKENKVKLLGKYITDRKKYEKRLWYSNSGSLDNPFAVRTLYIKNKRRIKYPKNKKYNTVDAENADDSKTTIGFAAYDKGEEIDNNSPHKTYILDYHKAHNPKCKNIYREEIRLESEEWRRYEEKRKKQGKPITLTDLLSKEFLYEVWTEYIDRIIVIRDSKNRKIDLFPKPYLGECKGKLPLTLPQGPDESPFIEYNDIPFIENRNKDFNNIEYLTAKFFNNQDYN